APAEPPYSPAVAEALARLSPPPHTPLALFRTLAVNERVFLRIHAGGLLDQNSALPFGSAARSGGAGPFDRSSIALRDRELVIDPPCYRCGSEYEWGVHVAIFGSRAGLTADEVRDLCADDVDATVFSPRDRLLLALCDELHATARVSDALWAALAAE